MRAIAASRMLDRRALRSTPFIEVSSLGRVTPELDQRSHGRRVVVAGVPAVKICPPAPERVRSTANGGYGCEHKTIHLDAEFVLEIASGRIAGERYRSGAGASTRSPTS
jgi:hypothetical protein